ncbi:hypothetical protein BRADI_2g02677v3 [Brachypodium distachyon]|uniref:Uncharacterized protein n=1 Tax=Brachypodium distachyon TaxID=15368 RepID=A0A2K2D6K6_BRADI|nr:hypothetical protein BRADI_2g02677v3 [Brachypodium distachyon]
MVHYLCGEDLCEVKSGRPKKISRLRYVSATDTGDPLVAGQPGSPWQWIRHDQQAPTSCVISFLLGDFISYLRNPSYTTSSPRSEPIIHASITNTEHISQPGRFWGFPRLSVLRSPSRAAADRRTVPCCPPPLPSAARAEPCSVARRSNEPREAFGWFVPSQARLASIGDGRRNSDMAWSTARRRLNRGSSLKDCRMAILLVWFMIHMDGVLGG